MKKVIPFLLALLMTSAASYTQASELSEIELVLNKYLDGTSQGKPELVKEVFLPSLEIQWLGSENQLMRRTAESYIARIQAGKNVPREGRIVSMDVSGKIAQAKIEIEWNNRLYTDYLLLMKVKERWWIANKIAHWKVLD